MKNRSFSAFYLALLIITTACASIAPAPKSMDQGLAYVYAGITTARLEAAQLLKTKTISLDDAKLVQNLADQARSAADIARTYSQKGDTLSAQNSLELATQVLAQINTYLVARRKASP